MAAGLAILASPGHAQDTIKLGNIVATSGPLKGPGQTAVVAFDLAVKNINAHGGINGKKIQVFRYDTGSDAKQAAVGARKLIEDDHVLAIVGPLSSGETKVALNIAERYKTLMMPTSSSAPGLTTGKKYVWRISADEATQFKRLLDTIKEKGIKADTAAIIYISDEVISNITGTKVYPKVMDEAGIKHGAPIPIQYKSFDMSAEAAKIMQQNPDVVAIAALPEAAAKVIHALRQQGYKGRFIGSQLFADPNNVNLFGPDGNGTIFVTGFWKGENAEAEAFDKGFAKLAKEQGLNKLGPWHTDAQAYDTVYVVKKAMEKAGVTGDPSKLASEREAIADAMNGIHYSGVLGENICFSGHDASLPGYVIEIKDQKWTLLNKVPADKCK